MENIIEEIKWRKKFLNYYLLTKKKNELKTYILNFKKKKILCTEEENNLKLVINSLDGKIKFLEIDNFNIKYFKTKLYNVEKNLDNSMKKKGFFYLGGLYKSDNLKREIFGISNKHKLNCCKKK